jgi:hypothetical protein
MAFGHIRSISALLMVFVLAVGLASHCRAGPDVVLKSAATVVKNIPTSGAVAMTAKCAGCLGNKKGMAHPGCCTLCGVAIPALALNVVFYPAAGVLGPLAGPDAIGRVDPPDPHPPKSVKLS